MSGPEIVAAIVLKAIGAIAGTFVALVFLPPRRWKEFLARAMVGPVVGIISAPHVRDYLGWPATEESIVSSAALGAFISWWGLGAILRVVRLAGSKGDAPDRGP